jgi:hypothetical protein
MRISHHLRIFVPSFHFFMVVALQENEKDLAAEREMRSFGASRLIEPRELLFVGN